MLEMEEQIKQAKLTYLECQKGHLHEGEQLNFICVDPSCTESGLICSICRIENHQKHKVMPMKLFLCEVVAKMKSRTTINNNIDELLSELDTLNSSILSNLREVVESLAQTIKTFEISCANSSKQIREKIISQVFMSENMPKVIDSIINNEFTDASDIKQEIKRILESVHFSDKKGLEIDIRPEKSIETFRQIEQDVIKSIWKAQKSFSDSFKKLEKQFEKSTQNSSTDQPTFTFGSIKSPQITITDKKIAEQTAIQNLENRFALLEPELSLDQPTRFAFQVKSLTHWVGVGICLKNHLEKQSLKFDYNTVGHGAYLISSNGFSWSHSQAEDNVASKSFSFTNSDIIICEFDYSKKQLSFKKYKSSNRFTMTVSIPEGEKVFACVNLCNKGEKIEIISNIDLYSEEM